MHKTLCRVHAAFSGITTPFINKDQAIATHSLRVEVLEGRVPVRADPTVPWYSVAEKGTGSLGHPRVGLNVLIRSIIILPV